MTRTPAAVSSICLLLVAACSAPPAPEAEWMPLFDGKTFNGWRGVGRESIPAKHWVIEDGMIRKVASGRVPTAADGQPLGGGTR